MTNVCGDHLVTVIKRQLRRNRNTQVICVCVNEFKGNTQCEVCPKLRRASYRRKKALYVVDES